MNNHNDTKKKKIIIIQHNYKLYYTGTFAKYANF